MLSELEVSVWPIRCLALFLRNRAFKFPFRKQGHIYKKQDPILLPTSCAVPPTDQCLENLAIQVLKAEKKLSGLYNTIGSKP